MSNSNNQEHSTKPIDNILAIVAIVTAFLLFLSFQASNRDFVAANRPFLSLKSVPNEKGLFISTENRDEGLAVWTNFEIKNVGNTIAKDIKFPNTGVTKTITRSGKSISLGFGEISLPSIVELVPGESILFSMGGFAEEDGKSDKFFFNVDLDVLYKDSFAKENEYKTSISSNILRDKVKINYQIRN